VRGKRGEEKRKEGGEGSGGDPRRILIARGLERELEKTDVFWGGVDQG